MSPGILMRCSFLRAALQEQEVHVVWLVRHIQAGQHSVHQGARAPVHPLPYYSVQLFGFLPVNSALSYNVWQCLRQSLCASSQVRHYCLYFFSARECV